MPSQRLRGRPPAGRAEAFARKQLPCCPHSSPGEDQGLNSWRLGGSSTSVSGICPQRARRLLFLPRVGRLCPVGSEVGFPE